MCRFLFCFILLVLPVTATATVEITEIAWMGTDESATHEWIELTTTGNSVQVDGWQLIDGNNISIALTGVIPARSSVVLERTSDASAPGNAFLIYTGALSNTGATLQLSDATGAIVDQVAGGTDWSLVGGDNQTKQTAQKEGNIWVTDVATPGTATVKNTSPSQPSESTESTNADPQPGVSSDTNTTGSTNTKTIITRSSSGGSESLSLSLPGTVLQLAITGPAQAHVGQPISFNVEPSGVGDTLANSLQYTWNFGDGTVWTGEDASHAYYHPGRYVVVVSGEYKRQYQTARMEIEVLPTTLTIETTADGQTVIRNTGEQEIDLGGYRLVGHDTFTVPTYTYVLPGQQLRIEADVIGTDQVPGMIALYNQSDQVVATLLPPVPRIAPAPTSPTVITQPSVARPMQRISALATSPQLTAVGTMPKNQFTFANTETVSAEPEESMLVPAAEAAEPQTATVADAADAVPNNWPLLVLVGLLLLTIAAIFFLPAPARSQD